MSALMLRLSVFENGDEAMSIDVAYPEMRLVMDAYFGLISQVVSEEEFLAYVEEVKAHVASQGRLQ